VRLLDGSGVNREVHLICGSIAYDTIMVFGDRFKNHILPEQIHILNVAFLVPDMRREFGGCAGNIAYNLKLLGGEPLIMATVGDDSAPYMHRLKQLGLDAAHVRRCRQLHRPGLHHHRPRRQPDHRLPSRRHDALAPEQGRRCARDVSLGIVSPDGRDGMLQHAREFAAAGIPFVFDPGQGLPMFDGDELMAFLKLADYCTVNDYEAKLLTAATGSIT
jgi:adenosine kinase